MVLVCPQPLMNLLLTGRASSHVFNGTLQFGEDGQPLERPLKGVLSRSDVGYLHWSREQMKRDGLPQVSTSLPDTRQFNKIIFALYYVCTSVSGLTCVNPPGLQRQYNPFCLMI